MSPNHMKWDGRCLVLDDSPERIEWFRGYCTQLDWVKTVPDAISALQRSRYNVIFLDHDLGTEPAVGRDVAKWLIQTKAHKNTPIWVHSQNVVSGPKIERELRDAGYDVVWRPFPPIHD